VQGVAQLGVIDSQVTTQGMDLQAIGGGDEVDGPLHLVEQG
jgi:hypothetical protein